MKSSSSKFRVKIDMSNVSVNPSRWWFLVNPQNCETVEELKQQIISRFQLLYSTRRIEVVVQDFIVPDDEQIDVLKAEDTLVLRLKSSKLGRFIKAKEDEAPEELQSVADTSAVINEDTEHERKKRKKPKKSEESEQTDHSVQKAISLKKVRRNLMKDINETVVEPNESSTKTEETIPDECQFEVPLPRKRRRRRRRNSLEKDDTPETIVAVDDTSEVTRFPREIQNNYQNCKRKHLRFDDDEEVAVLVNNPETKSEQLNENRHPNTNNTAENEIHAKQESHKIKFNQADSCDLSKCQPLIGPPRPQDRIVYQVLELSETYTPELSSLRIGRVTSYNATSSVVTMELENPLAMKARKGKFELVEDAEDDDESVEKEEQITYITTESHQLSELIDAKILVD